MGVLCRGQTPSSEADITKINNNPIIYEQKEIEKIILIQRRYRIFQARKKLSILKNEKIDSIYKELEEMKLIDFNRILESKSEQYYNRLILSRKIIPFEELVESNKNIRSKLNSYKNLTFNFPFHVQVADEKIYKGSWNYDKQFHGFGVIYEFNSQKGKDSKTEGIFNNGLLNGFGRIFLSNEEILIGDFIYNKLNGPGEYYRNDGSMYKGSFFEGLPQGNGKEIFNNGSIFTGFYLAGKKKHGKFLWKNGNYYQGDFVNDVFHGYGVYKWGKERTYEGNWKEGKMHGKGKLMLIDGSYYDGEFVEGKKCGRGLYVWNKDKYFEGEWKNDKQNGYGIYFKNGNKLKGFWINGKLISNYKNNNTIEKNEFHSSPDNRNKTIDVEGNNLRTSECKEIEMISGFSSQFNTIRSDTRENYIKKHNMKRNNTHIFISKKVQNKKFIGGLNHILNSNKETKKINIINGDK